MKKSLQEKVSPKGDTESRWRANASKTSIVNAKTHSKVVSKVVSRDVKGGSGLTLPQLKTLKLCLGDLRDEIMRSIQIKTEHVLRHAIDLENTLQGDDAEVAEKQRLSNSNLQEMEFLKTRIALVERALLKMKEGVYGICEETEEPIGFERLQVVPWARFSIKIQEKREIRSREFGRIQRAE